MAEPEDPQVGRHIRAEADAALTKGGLIAAALGFFGGLFPAIAMLAGAAENLEAPVVFANFAAAYSLLIWALARSGRMRGRLLYLVILPFVSLPTFFFVGCHFALPAGAASFITGPISYLYFFLIIMTGFLFRPRLSIAAGFVCGAGYLLSFGLAAAALGELRGPDPTVVQDLTNGPIWAIKAFMMVFAGFGVALISLIAKRLILRVLEEERHKTAIGRLFGQYVSEEVKDKIISEKSETLGERKDVVVLFSDIRSFSTYSEALDPEVVVRDLNEYFDSMVRAVSTHGGVIDKFIGDAIMAVFGGVIELESAAASAVLAAREMRRNLRELNERWETEGRARFDNGIGMHFGEVLQGSLGSAERKEFTVIGDTVNTAARLEGRTKDFPESILVSGTLHAALPKEMRAWCTDHGTIAVKGRREEVPIYGIADPEPT